MSKKTLFPEPSLRCTDGGEALADGALVEPQVPREPPTTAKKCLLGNTYRVSVGAERAVQPRLLSGLGRKHRVVPTVGQGGVPRKEQHDARSRPRVPKAQRVAPSHRNGG